MIQLSGRYQGKQWRTLGNCFYDSGSSPLWARRHVNTSRVREHVLANVFKLGLFHYDPDTYAHFFKLFNLFSSLASCRLCCWCATRWGLSSGSRLPLYEPRCHINRLKASLPTLLLFHRLSSSKGNRRVSLSSWENHKSEEKRSPETGQWSIYLELCGAPSG